LKVNHLPRPWLRAVRDLPELNIALFAFLLNFVWEMFQIVLYQGMKETPHSEAVLTCTQATLGDVGIALAAFWSVAWLDGGRQWPHRPTAARVAGFALIGILVTIAFKLLATRAWKLWSYSQLMPVIPLLEISLVPLVQWMVLPPFIIWFVHRQLT